jgi:hypothetical protein
MKIRRKSRDKHMGEENTERKEGRKESSENTTEARHCTTEPVY